MTFAFNLLSYYIWGSTRILKMKIKFLIQYLYLSTNWYPSDFFKFDIHFKFRNGDFENYVVSNNYFSRPIFIKINYFMFFSSMIHKIIVF